MNVTWNETSESENFAVSSGLYQLSSTFWVVPFSYEGKSMAEFCIHRQTSFSFFLVHKCSIKQIHQPSDNIEFLNIRFLFTKT